MNQDHLESQKTEDCFAEAVKILIDCHDDLDEIIERMNMVIDLLAASGDLSDKAKSLRVRIHSLQGSLSYLWEDIRRRK